MKEPAFPRYCSRLIVRHAARLQSFKRGTLAGGDSEALHQLRVSSRRLRTALWIAKRLFPRAAYRLYRRELRALTRALGAARDVDSQLDFLAENKTAAGRAAQTVVIGILRRRRLKLQLRVVQAVRRLEKRRILERLSADALRFGAARKDGAHSLRRTARKKIAVCLQELMLYERHVDDPDRIHELHQMRIAAKHLRYALESFRGLYGPAIDEYAAAARRLQKTLGEFHNFAVWGRVRQTREWCECRRLKAYRKFVKAWDKQRRAKVWKKLGEVL